MPGNLHYESVELLRRQVLQGLDLKYLSIPDSKILVCASVQQMLYDTIFAHQSPRGTQRYRYRILKKLLALISDACFDPDEDQISDDLASCLGALLESCPISANMVHVSAPLTTRIYYTPPKSLSASASNTIMIDEEANCYSGGGTTGHRTWEAALHLAYFLSGPLSPVSPGSKVLELGAGRGLVSYVCADVCQARTVIPTDVAESLVERLKANSPKSPGSWSPQVLDWELDQGPGSLANLPAETKTDLDLVLGADITFDNRILPALAKTISSLLWYNPSARALIAATVRNTTTLGQFVATCDERKLKLREIAADCPNMIKDQIGLFHSHDVPIKIYEISRS